MKIKIIKLMLAYKLEYGRQDENRLRKNRKIDICDFDTIN
jgi:hypothetical protein